MPNTSSVLPIDAIVRCPDGSVGRVYYANLDGYVGVVHDDRAIGRGPWEFLPEQIAPATAVEAQQYLARQGGAS